MKYFRMSNCKANQCTIKNSLGRQNRLTNLLRTFALHFFLVEFSDLRTRSKYLFSFEETVFSIWKICSLISKCKNTYRTIITLTTIKYCCPNQYIKVPKEKLKGYLILYIRQSPISNIEKT